MHTLVELLEERKILDEVGITFIQKTDHVNHLTYKQLYYSSYDKLAFLQEKGVERGDEIIFQIEDIEEFVVTFWACLMGGIIPVPLTIGNTQDHKGKVLKVFSILDNPYIIIGQRQFNNLLDYATKNGFQQDFERLRSQTLFLEKTNIANTPPLLHSVQKNDIAYIQFSSGSTGNPKGVLLTHHNLICNLKAIAKAANYSREDTMLSWMPLTHDMGLIGLHLNPLFSGMQQYIISTNTFIRNPAIWLEKVSEHKASIIASPNFGYEYLMKHCDLDKQDWDLSNVRIIYNGAEPISKKLCADFMNNLARFGLKPTAMCPVYGLAEATLAVSMSDLKDEVISLRIDRTQLKTGHTIEIVTKGNEGISFVSVGKSIDYCTFRITGDNDQVLKDKMIGHVQIRGESVTSGYYKNPTATRDAFTTDGWLKSGDLGFMYDNALYITGRSKDIFFINGQNYYSHDIERLAEEVQEVELNKIAIVGHYNADIKKEEVIAFVFHRGAIEEFAPVVKELTLVVNQKTGLDIDKVLPVSNIPRTTSGKLQRYKLLQKYKEGFFDNIEKELTPYLRAETSAVFIPANEQEQKLLDIWNRVLGYNTTILKSENFLEAGGNSLKAAEICMLIHKELQIEVLPKIFYEKQSILEIASEIAASDRCKFVPISGAPVQLHYPLASSQRRLYYVWLSDRDSTAYNIPVAFTISGTLDEKKLEKSMRELILRYEVFRMIFTNPVEPKIRLREKISFHLKRLHISGKEDQKIVCEQIKPFNLENGPLFRASLLKISSEKQILFLDFHHIISDGLSVFYFVEELFDIYRGQKTKDLPVTFTDVILWEKERLNSTSQKKQEAYWIKQLDGELPLLELPTDYPRPVMFNTKGARKAYPIDKDMRELLVKTARSNNCTLHVLLFTIYYLLLQKYTRQKDIIIGIPTAGRNHPDLLNMLGMFANSLAVRITQYEEETFNHLLEKVKQTITESLRHQEYPFDSLVEKVYKKKNTARNPIFDTMFIYQNMGFPEVENQDFTLSSYFLDPGFAKYDISIEFFDVKDALSFNIEYATSLFNEVTINRLAKGFLRLVNEITVHPTAKLATLSVLSEEKRHTILEKFNATATPFPSGKTIHQLFEEQVEKTPNQTAIEYDGGVLSFEQLNHEANQLCKILQKGGLVQEEVTGILLPRSSQFIISMLGILKAGGSYLPIDTEMPVERIAYILSDSKCDKLITKADQKQHLAAINCIPDNIILIENMETSGYVDSNLTATSLAHTIAYVIYTSGTTSGPKGVMISHRSFVNYITWAASTYIEDEGADFPLFTSVAFDLTLTSIFLPLLTGNKVIIYPGGQDLAIQQVLKDNKAHVIKLTPSHLRLMKDYVNPDLVAKSSIKRIIVGGEVLDEALARDIHNLFNKKVKIFNEYGPTEATVGCMVYSFNPEENNRTVPIGVPISNTKIYLLDEHLQPVPDGVPGDIYISGVGLAKGYLYNETLTSDKFVDNPFIDSADKMYYTGDTAKRQARGKIEFIGRTDKQVKISGYRVELTEIERVILSHTQVKGVVVKLDQNDKGHSLLFAYYTLTDLDTNAIKEEVLRNHLIGKLPYYMIPTRFIALTHFPLTYNGKIDYDGLPQSNDAPSVIREFSVKNTVTKELTNAWKAVLKTDQVSVNRNFFELGGDSIKAVQIASRLAEKGLIVDVKDILTYGTISQISECIKDKNENHYEQGYIDSEIKSTPIISWFFSGQFNKPAYFMQSVMLTFHQEIEIVKLEEAFDKVIKHHDTLRINYSNDTNTIYYNRQYLKKGFSLLTYSIRDADEIPDLCNQMRAGWNLSEDLLIKAAVFYGPGKKEELFITAHHLVIDGVSWRILLEDLIKAYSKLKNDENVELQKKTAAFSLWAHQINSLASASAVRETSSYWKESTSASFKIPLDVETEDWRIKNLKRIRRSIGYDDTQYLLKDANRTFKTDILILLNTVLVLTLGEWSGFNEIVIEEENHGRHVEGIDVSRTIGWFTAMYPMKFTIPEEGNLTELIKMVKERIRKVPEHGLGYGLLKYIANDNALAKSDEISEVRFIYLGQFGSELVNEVCSYSAMPLGNDISPDNTATTKLEILCMVVDCKLKIEILYNVQAHYEKTIEWLVDKFLSNIQLITEHIRNEKEVHFTISDFEGVDLNKEELDSLFL